MKNTSSNGQDTYGVCYNNSASSATSLFNCLGWGNGDAAEDPGFRNPEKGNFHLKSSSPYVDTATVYGWMSGDVDLDGKPRIQGRRPDYGCYERMVGGFTVIVR